MKTARLFLFVMLAAAALLLQSCAHVYDTTVGASNICEVHHVTMQKVRVYGFSGCILRTPDSPEYERAYEKAHKSLFPNVVEPTLARKRGEMADSPMKVYECPECQRAYEHWQHSRR